tara:strand:- start:337 stop:930 length:594 start_codon:yes stop_codon:yes gene_type:complete
MKTFIAVIVLIFSLQSLTKADDIKEIEIEGMSIGDNLLDHFSLDHIKKFNKEFYPKSKKFYEQYIHWPEKGDFEVYSGLTISLKENEYKIFAITGNLSNFSNFEECLNKKDQIIKDITSSFKTKIIYDGLENDVFDYADNNSVKSQVQILLNDNSGLIAVDCVDWSDKAEKKNNWIDNLGVQIASKEYENFLRNEAY